ncbi:TraM recognition domain-containing protein [Halostella pelagica]|uniref:TraM recognition domain-containing protein n=1 Tax=Halostella pelagica TaxID=2583824 RepID=UPI00108000DD|nr:type IV secretory system conjugative DNA transfer family protein [Halostella pelagica]
MNPETARKRIQDPDSRKTYFGSRTSRLGVEEHVGILDEKRLTHVLNLGQTGEGKSQLLLHTALQDAEKGHGLCLVNPKGSLIDEFLAKLPEERWDDVIYINPSRDGVASINVLETYTNGRMSKAQKENQKEIIVSDLIDLFRRRSENWGDRFGRILETVLRAFLDLNIKNGESNTLVDVYRSIINPDVLTELIDRTRDPVICEQLVRIKEDMTSRELEPLQRRLNDFVMNSTVRRVIEGESGVDFRDAVNQGKIILLDIQKGELGDTASQIIGSIVITKVWAAAQSRVTQSIDQREPFYLFVDELQNFTGEAGNFAKILSEAREYRLGCWLATQYLHQLGGTMQRSVTNNCRTKICFNPRGSEDETRIAGMLQGVEKRELKRLGKYRAAVQRPAETSLGSAVFIDTYPPWNADRGHIDKIKQRRTPEPEPAGMGIAPSLGKGTNSGGEKHTELLTTAKDGLEDRGIQVDLLYQGTGDDKPDGHAHLPDGTVAHLEAEHTTLSKPAKVLENLLRAVEQGRDCIFVVEQGNAEKLESIVSDPVNRHDSEHSDGEGSFSYYTDSQGEPFTSVDRLEDADYRILEVRGGDAVLHQPGSEPEEEDGSEEENGSEERFEEVREVDHTILTRIKEGKDDTHRITSSTGLPNHKVNYSLTKLEELGLINVEDPIGPVERMSNGQKRVFKVKPVSLTTEAEEYLERAD